MGVLARQTRGSRTAGGGGHAIVTVGQTVDTPRRERCGGGADGGYDVRLLGDLLGDADGSGAGSGFGRLRYGLVLRRGHAIVVVANIAVVALLGARRVSHHFSFLSFFPTFDQLEQHRVLWWPIPDHRVAVEAAVAGVGSARRLLNVLLRA